MHSLHRLTPATPIPATSHHYRPDIDGLRAIAVAPVLVFHAFPESLPGGFVGVDVFFANSGYLIPGLIFADLPVTTGAANLSANSARVKWERGDGSPPPTRRGRNHCGNPG